MSVIVPIAIVLGSVLAVVIFVALCILIMVAVHYLYCSGGVNKHNPDMKGKIVIITGGTDGIGKESVLKLAQLGAKIIFTGRSEIKAKEVLRLVP